VRHWNVLLEREADLYNHIHRESGQVNSQSGMNGPSQWRHAWAHTPVMVFLWWKKLCAEVTVPAY